MQKGKIGVTTENIFPIIKKFLYSDHEIFLRELVSNAVDASQKMKILAGNGEFKGELGDLTIKISANTEKNTITVSDRGIGMSAEEVERYINQIAFSSAGEFLDKYKDQMNNIIGHFGLGFYSSFMVSKKVEIETLSWREGAEPVKWSCEGTPDYKITKGKRRERGTDIILYLDDESKDYAVDSKIEYLLGKYCRFLPVEISFKEQVINEVSPLWTRKPSELSEEDYMKFYRDLYLGQEDPLFHIHLNVDYPFTLTGILYFPRIKDKIEITRNKVQLYCNQVYVTDSVENIVPDFLTLLHGVIDSPDIPLNVSRSYLQSDTNVKKISGYITKKVADRLEDLFKNERPKFEEKWDNLKLFIEYGMLTEEKFYERAEKFAIFKNTDDKYFNYGEYRTLIEPNQTDKNKKLVYLYTTDKVNQYAYIESAKSKGYDVLVFDSHLDAHFVNLLESKFQDSAFVRVDSDQIDRLIQKEELSKPDLTTQEIEDIATTFEAVFPQGAYYHVTVENLNSADAVLITQSEFMRRYRDMSALSGGMNFYGSLPESYNIIINYQNPVIQKIVTGIKETLSENLEELGTKSNKLHSELELIDEKTKGKKPDEIDTADKEAKTALEKEVGEIEQRRKEILATHGKSQDLIKQVADLALLSNGMLKGEDLNKFVLRSLSHL